MKKQKYLFIGGFFEKEDEQNILKHSKGQVQYAANEFQRKLINGLTSNIENKNEFYKISAPFVGSYPTGYSKIYFKSMADQNEFVDFFNLFAVRNISRKRNLISMMKKKKTLNNEKLNIFIYSTHTPLLDAALYLKRKNKNVSICLIVPDLPQYMNLNKKKSFLYTILKKIDINFFTKKLKKIDSFVLLTDKMTDALNIVNKPTVIIDGIIDNMKKNDIKVENGKFDNVTKLDFILYTGTLNEKYGVLNLIKAFDKINNPNISLLIAGNGDSKEEIKKYAAENQNCYYLGQITNNDAKYLQEKALFLVNPRENNEEYTKYSFPSKNIEYLSSGRPVVCYKLDGISEEYEQIFEYVETTLEEKLSEMIKKSKNELDEIGTKGQKYVLKNKTADIQCKKIIEMIEWSEKNV